MITNQNTYDFLKLFDRNDIRYHYEDKWLVIDGEESGRVYLYSTFDNSLLMPDYIKFNNDGYVQISNRNITSLPDHIEFNNKGAVGLSHNKLTSLPDNIQFNNDGQIHLYGNPLESLPDNIDEFYNRLDDITKEYISKKFPDHWVFEKERFGL